MLNHSLKSASRCLKLLPILFLCLTSCVSRVSPAQDVPPGAKVDSGDRLKIVAFSDINGSLGNTEYPRTVRNGLPKMLQESPDIMIGAGDYIAGGDTRKKFPLSRFHDMWRSFQVNILAPILERRIEFAPSPGNHDAPGYSSMKRERDVYSSFWQRERPRLEYVNDRHFPKFYSYKMKGVFFISMDNVVTHRLHNGEIQREWIREQLMSEEAQSAKARIVHGHIPLYPLLDKGRHSRSGGRGKYYEVLGREQLENSPNGLEAILLEGKVSLAVFGHSHSFFPGTVIHQTPGQPVRQLRILSMPCLGAGARFLSGQSRRSTNAYAVINVDERGQIEIQGKNAQGEVIPRDSLPERIIVPGKHNRYYRDDRVPSFFSSLETVAAN